MNNKDHDRIIRDAAYTYLLVLIEDYSTDIYDNTHYIEELGAALGYTPDEIKDALARGYF